MKVLIVDDDPHIRSATERQLKLRGFDERRVACDGAEAMEVLKDFQPDVIISDNDMPVMSGTELFTNLPMVLQQRFILCSGSVKPSIQMFCEKNNVLFLAKPYSGAELDEAIAKISHR